MCDPATMWMMRMVFSSRVLFERQCVLDQGREEAGA